MNNNRSAHARNLRKGRYSQDHQAYLVTTVTRERRKIFADFPVARILAQCLRKEHDDEHVESLAFVIMPDHLHWLFSLKNGYSLSKVMQGVKGGFSHSIRKYCRNLNIAFDSGPLWQDGFYDRALRKEEDLLDIARYIVANPRRAGLVTKIGDYSFWDAKWL